MFSNELLATNSNIQAEWIDSLLFTSKVKLTRWDMRVGFFKTKWQSLSL
jgi:hypothetical protein